MAVASSALLACLLALDDHLVALLTGRPAPPQQPKRRMLDHPPPPHEEPSHQVSSHCLAIYYKALVKAFNF